MYRKLATPGVLLCIGALLCIRTGSAFAEGGLQMPPITDAATQKECGACHIAFPPQMLPARSWQAVMDNLGKHFGEDASLPAADRKAITDYLTANAADGTNTRGAGFLIRGIAAGDTPLRITETPYWQRGHREVSSADFTNPKVKSPANCGACHTGAAQGTYGEPGE